MNDLVVHGINERSRCYSSRVVPYVGGISMILEVCNTTGAGRPSRAEFRLGIEERPWDAVKHISVALKQKKFERRLKPRRPQTEATRQEVTMARGL